MKKIVVIFLMLFGWGELKSEPINWLAPTILSTAGLDATEPQIAVDNSGNSAAVWVQNGVVMFSNCPASGQWQYPLITLSLTSASQPQLTMDFEGNITVIWLQGGVVYTNSKPAGGLWGLSLPLSGLSATTPRLVVDSNGNNVAVWIRSGKVEASIKLYQAGWQISPAVLSSTQASYPVPSIGTDGRVMVLWNQFDGVSYSVVATYKTIPNSWIGPQVVTSSLAGNPYCYVNLNDSSQGIAVWYNYTASSTIGPTLEYASWSATGGWSSPATLTNSGVSTPEAGGVMTDIDTNGNKLFLWKTQYLEDSFGLTSMIISSNGTVNPPVDLLSFNLYTYAADLKMVPPGHAVVAYMSFDERLSVLSIDTSFSNISGYRKGYWAVPRSISTSAINGYPRIDVKNYQNTLNVAAIWTTYNGVNKRIMAATGFANLLQPPSNLAVTQLSNNLGIFTEYYNKLVWQASPSPEVLGYVVYRNGEVFAEIKADRPLEIYDRNTGYNESVTYGVAAMNNGEGQSSVATVTFP